MRNLAEIKERFLREDAKMQTGHLASDLARIVSLLGMKTREETIKGVMEEAKFFAEWAGSSPGIPTETQMLLAEIQGFLAQKALELNSSGGGLEWREKVAVCLRGWSGELLKKSGFIESYE